MKTLTSLVAATVLSILLSSMGCEVSHSESDKEGWFGGHKHEETTVTKNPVTGDTHVEHSEQHVNP
jgi:hypothetical protein